MLMSVEGDVVVISMSPYDSVRERCGDDGGDVRRGQGLLSM